MENCKENLCPVVCSGVVDLKTCQGLWNMHKIGKSRKKGIRAKEGKMYERAQKNKH